MTKQEKEVLERMIEAIEADREATQEFIELLREDRMVAQGVAEAQKAHLEDLRKIIFQSAWLEVQRGEPTILMKEDK